MDELKTVPGIGYEWPVRGLTQQLADGFTQRHPMTGCMNLRYLQRIIFNLKCCSWHQRIMSASMMRIK